MSIIANRYAESLFSLGLDKNKVDVYKEDLKKVRNAFQNVDNLKDFFSSEQISKDDKKEVLISVFKNKLNKDILNFLKLLVDKGRISYYEDIIKAYIHLANDELNIKEGIIESPRSLDAKSIKKLEKALSSKDIKVELHERINPSLISGFKVIFDDEVIDASMKEKINKLHNSLSNKGGKQWN